MSAIITDQLRILNAENFVNAIGVSSNSYYAFIGLPNATEYDSEWDITPPSPKDCFDEENDYWDTMTSLKRISKNDVKRVIRKIQWESGFTYDMYRHDISRTNLSQPSEATSLYYSNFYVVNKDYKVYICIHNGTDENNFSGKPSLDEPLFTDLEPKPAGSSNDGYLWKYLYTINPSDIIKFDSIDYIPLPDEWGVDESSSAIKLHASTSGQIKNAVIADSGANIGPANQVYNRVPIKGDGSGAEATVIIDSESRLDSVIITNGGSGYTYAVLDFAGGGLPVDTIGYEEPDVDVIIPPQGGHGYNIYKELGATRVLLYCRIENDLQNPDFILGNQVARFGIVKNPLKYGSNDILDDDKVSALHAIKLIGNISDGRYLPDSIITQNVSTGTTAAGRVVSYNENTGVLKYWQDRTLYGFNFDKSRDYTPSYGYGKVDFTSNVGGGGSLLIIGEVSSLEIDTDFGTESNPGITTVINNRTYSLGQEFQNGISNPEVKKYSGDIIYVDNRPSITRSQNQKEDIKVILQF